MKMRPQVNGPIDVGYGNYLLTAPADRQGRRRRRKKKKNKGATDNDVVEEEDEDDDRDSNMRREKKVVARTGKTMENGKYDVPELLSTANTLTNPNNTKNRNKKSELYFCLCFIFCCIHVH